MDVLHNGGLLPDATPTGGPGTTSLSVQDGTGISWAITRKAGQVVATPTVITSVLPGSEIGYDQITAGVSITGTTLAGATQVIAGSAHTFDGAPVIAEFFSPTVELPAAAGATMSIYLFEGGAAITALSVLQNPASAANWVTVLARQRFTPSAASHTYSIYAVVSTTTGTPTIFAQGGTGSSEAPAYLRFTKV